MKGYFKTGILILSILALIYVVYRIGIDRILSVIPRALHPQLLIFILFYYFGIFLRGVRWRTLLGGVISYWEGFRMLMTTLFFNLVSPVRVGDLWKINASKKYGIGKVTAAAIIERVLDVTVAGLIVAISAVVVGTNLGSQMNQGITGAVVMILVAAVAIIILQDRRSWKFASQFLPLRGNEYKSVRDFLKNRITLGKSFTLSFLIWINDLLNFYFLSRLIYPIPFPAAALSYLVSALLGSSIISSVAVAQTLILISMLSFWMPYADAAAIGILLGLLGYWLQIPIAYLIYTKG